MSIFAFLINLFLFLSVSSWARASYDPTSVPNNKIGLHILFPDEVSKAAGIVNNGSQAAWGYITIPLQATDRNREKWQAFLDKCREFKVIPIIRVATVPEGSNWTEPNNFDLVDFANFLNDLKWPTGNRYIIIFNEVNRADEYGGVVSPENYADILNNAIDIFKSKSSDFFILPAGLDNAAVNTKTSIAWKTYLQRMYQKQPDIFNKIDGWTSHAYPNPDFSSRPDSSGINKIDSYIYDLRFLRQYTNKKLPVFITEAGWSNRYLNDHQISLYYQYAFKQVWSDNQVVAVTPFLLSADEGPFEQFSFLTKDGSPKEFAQTLSSFAIKGEPHPSVPNIPIPVAEVEENTPAPTVLGTQTDSSVLLKRLYNSLLALLGIFGK